MEIPNANKNRCKVAESHLKQELLSLTNRATHLCKCNSVADLLKTPPHMCYHAEFGCYRSNHAHISSGEPAKLGSASAVHAAIGWGRGWPPKISPSPYLLTHPIWSFFRVLSVVIKTGESQKLGSAGAPPIWDGAVADPLSIGVTTSNLVGLCQNKREPKYWGALGSAWKIWPPASRLSRSLKIIITDTDRSATYDFLLTFYSNHGPTSYHFHDKRWFHDELTDGHHRSQTRTTDTGGRQLWLRLGLKKILLFPETWTKK